MNSDNKYYVLFDELDLNFDPSDENYRLRIIGLLTAAREMNNYAIQNGKNLNVIVFLREDIYQFLKFEDKNKMTEGAVVRIEWDTVNSRHTLRELMAKRIEAVTECSENGWDYAFDESQNMRGRQTKYQHILDRTMLRPRDIIKFCNVVLGIYKASMEDGQSKFSNADINNARSEYSKYLLSELDDEIFRHIPRHEKYSELLRDLDAVQFKFHEFEEICSRRAAILVENETPSSILTNLFEFSIIGYYQPGGSGYGGAEYIFRYRSPRANFNPKAQEFQVHLGLQEALSLKRYRKGQNNEG